MGPGIWRRRKNEAIIFVSFFINTRKYGGNSPFQNFKISNSVQVKLQKQHQETTTKTQAMMKKQASQQDMILKIKEDNVTMANKHFFFRVYQPLSCMRSSVTNLSLAVTF